MEGNTLQICPFDHAMSFGEEGRRGKVYHHASQVLEPNEQENICQPIHLKHHVTIPRQSYSGLDRFLNIDSL